MAGIAIDVIIILFFSVLGGILATRFRQPSVLGVLLAGALVGPNALGLLTDQQLMHYSIELGAILLLFLVGIEFSLEKLLDLGLRAVIVAAIKIGVIFLFAYHIALFFGLSPIAGVAIGIILSLTSTVIFMKILEQKGLSSRPEIPLLIAVLIIEDMFGVFSLTFFSGLASQGEITPLIILLRLVMALVLLGSVYMLIQKVLRPILNWLSVYSTQDTITFIAIFLCAAMSFMAHELGLSTAVGAFLAGNIVSSLKNAEAFEHAVHPFILTFTSLFFFSIGTVVDFSVATAHFWLIIALFIANILLNFTTIGISTYLFSIPAGRSAVFAGIAMIPLGEFSLLLAQQANPLVPGIDLISITAIIIFFSSLTMSLFIGHSQGVYKIVSAILPAGIRYDLGEASRYCRTLSSETILNKLTNKRLTFRWHTIVNNLVGIGVIVAILCIMYYAPQFQNLDDTFIGRNKTLIAAFAFLMLIFPTFSVIRNTRDALLDVSKSFIRLYPNEIANQEKIARNIVFIVLLFLFSFLIPAIISFLDLSPIWAIGFVPLIVILVIAIMKIGGFLISLSNSDVKVIYLYRRYREEMKRKAMVAKLKLSAMNHHKKFGKF
jgi:monovalent cation:H+ antiporter-2, CPA2 family